MKRIFAATVIFLGLSVVVISGCEGNLCGNVVQREVTQPAGKWKAVLFERDCEQQQISARRFP
jgi:hypothetical protein